MNGQTLSAGVKKKNAPQWLKAHVARKNQIGKAKKLQKLDKAAKSQLLTNKANGVASGAKKPQPLRLRTPTPPPLPEEAIPFETIRLHIDLQGLDNESRSYLYSVKELLKGQQPDDTTLSPEKPAEDVPNSPAKAMLRTIVKRKRRSKASYESYDLEDPFLDDSELRIDEPLTFGKAKESGFFVSAGDVELATIEPPERKSRVAPLNIPVVAPSGLVMLPQVMECLGPVASALLGTTLTKKVAKKDSEDAEQMEDNTDVSSMRTDVSAHQMYADFKEPTRHRLERLAAEVQAADFSDRKKFPQTLKDSLKETTQIAIDNGDYGEKFFTILPKIFPYNGFTMRRLAKRECYAMHLAALEMHLKTLQDRLKVEVASTAEEQKQAHEQAINGNTQAPETPAEDVDAQMDVDQPVEPEEGKPTRKTTNSPIWRWTVEQRSLFLACVKIVDEMCELTLEKHALDKTDPKTAPTQKQQRSTLYTYVVTLFPPGFMSNDKLSRVVANDKKRTDTVA